MPDIKLRIITFCDLAMGRLLSATKAAAIACLVFITNSATKAMDKLDRRRWAFRHWAIAYYEKAADKQYARNLRASKSRLAKERKLHAAYMKVRLSTQEKRKRASDNCEALRSLFMMRNAEKKE